MRAAFDAVIVDTGGKDTRAGPARSDRHCRQDDRLDQAVAGGSPHVAELCGLHSTNQRRTRRAEGRPRRHDHVNGSSNQYRRFIDGLDEFRDALRLLDSRLSERLVY